MPLLVRPMRIAYVAPVDLAERYAGCRHVTEICRGWATQGHSVTLFIPRLGADAVADALPGVTIVRVPVLPRPRVVRTVSFYLLLPFWLGARLRRRSADVVYTRTSFLERLAFAWLRRFFSFTYVGEVNGLRSLETERGRRAAAWIRRSERTTFRLMDAVVTVTQQLRDYVIGRGLLDAHCVAAVPNGVNTGLFCPGSRHGAMRQLGLDTARQYITFVGSMRHWHALADLVGAFKSVACERADARLLLVGDGPERKRARDLVEECGLSSRAIFAGAQPTEKVVQYLRASAFCVAPFGASFSRVTGLAPLKLFEYLACGRAVLTADAGPSVAFVEDDRCGLLYPLGDVQALAEQMLRLLDPELADRLGRNGRRVAVERHSWDQIAERISGLLDTWSRG